MSSPEKVFARHRKCGHCHIETHHRIRDLCSSGLASGSQTLMWPLDSHPSTSVGLALSRGLQLKDRLQWGPQQQVELYFNTETRRLRPTIVILF
jgi:hypothetical protein